MCFYAGPLTYLILLYVESIISPRVVGTKTNLALSSWNMGMLRKREMTEIENGGFGLLPIKEAYKVEKEKKTTETSKEYIEYMEAKMKLLMRAKTEAERVLDIAVKKFPRLLPNT